MLEVCDRRNKWVPKCRYPFEGLKPYSTPTIPSRSPVPKCRYPFERLKPATLRSFRIALRVPKCRYPFEGLKRLSAQQFSHQPLFQNADIPLRD